MKASHFFLFFALLISSLLYAQTPNSLNIKGYAVYKAGCDSLLLEEQLQRTKEKSPEQYAMIADNIRSANELLSFKPLELFFDRHQSLFREAPLAAENKANDPMVEVLAGIMAQSGHSIYVDKKEQIRLKEVTLNNGASYYHVLEEYDYVDWELSNETKKIGSYLCRFAKGSYMKNTRCCGLKEVPVAAWFAPEIPVPFGPVNFGNLPGLIIQISVGDPKEKAPVVYNLESIIIGEEAYKTFPKMNNPKQTLSSRVFRLLELSRLGF